MFDTVYIKALKSIKEMTVECSKLNIFVGTNSSGKSTFLQALLLAAQNSVNESGLNGKLISLGEFREARNYNMPNQKIVIKLTGNNHRDVSVIEFEEDNENESYKIYISGVKLPKIDENFHYLSCHRIGVKDIYDKNMENFNGFGIDGEYSLAYLLKNENIPVRDVLVSDEANITNSLLEQVNYWLYNIASTKLSITDLKKTNYLQVKYNNNPANDRAETLYCRPVNVGSGISYLISIIITCLGANEGDTVVIENPEIHLHPKAQSRLCDFLYFVSKAGVQLFVETHSDHIFNGLRAGIAQGKIKQEDVKVNFFAMNEQYETQCNPIVFGEYGKIIGTNEDMDINDLFDQFDIDLDRMLGI